MSVLKATSWGRTRGPKTLVGVQGGEVDVVAVSTLTDVTDGYSTENQRFLHVLLVDKNASTSLTVTIYGYSHAFQKWFPLETLTQGLLNSSNAATLVSAAYATELRVTVITRRYSKAHARESFSA